MRTRSFPAKQLLGAEEVLARLFYHEHTKSKAYGRLGLGKILSRRTYAASGQLNPLAAQRASVQKMRLEGGELVVAPDIAIMDGATVAEWAWILGALRWACAVGDPSPKSPRR